MARYSEFAASIKSEARGALLGNLGVTVGANLLTLLISAVLLQIGIVLFPGTSVISFLGAEAVSYLIALFLGIVLYGLFYIYMSLSYGQPAVIADLFRGFTNGAPDRIIRVQAVLSGISLVCMLPAMIWMQTVKTPFSQAGIPVTILLYAGGTAAEVYFDLMFSMSYFVMIDFPQLGASDVLRTSRRMTGGEKGRLFRLCIGFLPLWLLGAISLGIANLWVAAYQLSSFAAFYRIKAAAPQKKQEVPQN
ncbi:MAG: DUF975 family protein [Lachnospiraceae bacterium]|jgi:uncharacterized membrane protein|nr:DUF975 family protein [Lachnospiraceae bacterium]